ATGKAPKVPSSRPRKGTLKSASQAMKRIGRSTSSESRIGSRYDGWLAATTTGPQDGILSWPLHSYVKRTRNSASRNFLNSRMARLALGNHLQHARGIVS